MNLTLDQLLQLRDELCLVLSSKLSAGYIHNCGVRLPGSSSRSLSNKDEFDSETASFQVRLKEPLPLGSEPLTEYKSIKIEYTVIPADLQESL